MLKTIKGEEFLTYNEFYTRCKNMYNSYISFSSKHPNIQCFDFSKAPTSTERGDLNNTKHFSAKRCTVIMNIKTGKTAFSYCNKKDHFDSYIGTAIAWARYRHIKIPKYLNSVEYKDLKIGETYFVDVEDTLMSLKYVGWSCEHGHYTPLFKSLKEDIYFTSSNFKGVYENIYVRIE